MDSIRLIVYFDNLSREVDRLSLFFFLFFLVEVVPVDGCIVGEPGMSLVGCFQCFIVIARVAKSICCVIISSSKTVLLNNILLIYSLHDMLFYTKIYFFIKNMYPSLDDCILYKKVSFS